MNLHMNITQDVGHGITIIFVCFVLVVVACLIDLWTGVDAARKNREKIKSRILRRTVAKILDYGKFRYDQQKREKEARKKQKVISVKEVKLRPNIEQHDFDVKLKNAVRFLEEGNKVKVTIMFRGRELSHPELGREILGRVAEQLKDSVSIERDAKLEGKNMIMILAPKAASKGGKQ